MNTTKQRLTVEQLEVGMFVYGLDRPMCETPFPLQGFFIESFDQIVQLAHYCRSVVIDLQRTQAVARCLMFVGR